MIERLIHEHPDWTDEQIAEAASAPVYADVPLSVVASLLVGRKRSLLAAAATLPSEIAAGMVALVESTESPHLRVIAAVDVPRMHALAAAAAAAVPDFADLASALQALGVTRGSHTAAEVARVRLLRAGRDAYDAAMMRLNESFNAWVGRVERGETGEPWRE